MAKKNKKYKDDSKKLAASLKKIDKLFDKCYEKGVTPNPQFDEDGNQRRWGSNTRDTYSNMMKSFVRDYHKRYGISDVTKMTDQDNINQLIQDRIDKFHSGETSESYNLKTLTAALKAFNYGVENTKVFKKEFHIGDAEKIREEMKEQNVVRRSNTSTVMRARPEDCISVLNNIKNDGYDVKTREIAYHAAKISMMTGGRISNILKLKAEDFVIDEKHSEIRFKKDKGGLSRSVRIDRETAMYLEVLKAGKEDSEPIFSSVRTRGEAKGTFKPVKELRKEITKVISAAGKHLETTVEKTIKDKDGKLKTVEVKQKFSPHSFRKSFALERSAYYLEKFDSTSSINKYVSRRIKDDEKLKSKLDTLRERINKDRTNDRDLAPHEYAIFFASVDMGHFRNDVITSFYTNFKEIEEYLEEKR